MMGVSVPKTMITAHVLCSVLTCIGGMIYTSRVGVASPLAGTGYEMYAIAAVVLGGAKLTGGVGKVSGSFIGTLIMSSFSNIFSMQNVLDAVWSDVVVGAVLLLSVIHISGSAQQDAVMQLIEASNLGPGDVAIAISSEGKSRTVVNAMRVAKERGATVICITKMSKSPLLKLSDINLFIATSDVTVGKDIVARRMAEQMIVDTLYLTLLVRSEKDYDKHLNSTSKFLEMNKIKGRGFK